MSPPTVVPPLAYLLSIMAPLSPADPVQWSHNGHYYELVDRYNPDAPGLGVSWTDANTEAQASFSYQGVPGHLATITSPEENAFLYGTFMTGFARAWFGLQYIGNQWTWVTQEAFEYTNWDPDLPGHDGGDWPLVPTIHPYGLMRGFDHLGGWNNLSDQPTSVYGFLVEYPVPEPSCLAILLMGGILGIRRPLRH